MVVKQQKRFLKNQKGFASIEALAMLFILASLISYSFGTFGTIHTGILNSISARAYLWEILDNRSSPIYLRSNILADTGSHFADLGFRSSGIRSEFVSDIIEHRSTGRNIDIRKRATASSPDNEAEHNKVYSLDLGQRTTVKVDNVWVKAQYGICMDSNCGGIQ